ncbi:hypothetical protein N7475_005957 [Penicillium sp. IBT 31633x]|nr:hypothetical protein N7475_005957 [Penicillium sp. IBT 31633x]
MKINCPEANITSALPRLQVPKYLVPGGPAASDDSAGSAKIWNRLEPQGVTSDVDAQSFSPPSSIASPPHHA